MRLLSLVSQCCGELMVRQRRGAAANFYAITGIMAFLPVFSLPVIRAGCQGVGWRIEGEMEGKVSVCELERVCVFVCGELRAIKASSRCLLWSCEGDSSV